VLTNLSLQSTASLLPDDGGADEMLDAYSKKLDNVSSLIHLTEDHLNSTWNKSYGNGGTCWDGPIKDGRTRGGMPYFCPHGWTRFSLKVCEDAEFEGQFRDWGYLYHGTNSKHVGSILTSGLRSSRGLCFCGPDDQAVYMSPSIEYSGHPRYGCIEYNPETRQWMQCVLQCRVKPSAVWQKRPETMHCAQFGLTCDPNVSNDQIEWLFKPTDFDPATGCYFIRDVIVCTGIMLRITDVHPTEVGYWWSKDPAYLKAWRLEYPIVDPNLPPDDDPSWIHMDATTMEQFSLEGSCMGSSFKVVSKKRELGRSKLSSRPFGKGGMRFAYYLRTDSGLYAVKSYNAECLKHITEGLRISEAEAIRKEVNTYLVADQLARSFNDALPVHWKHSSNMVKFLQPYVFTLRDRVGKVRIMFGETYVDGRFIKWNNNAGFVNTADEAKERLMDEMVQVFGHYTWHWSKGRLMVVDIQGWRREDATGARDIVFTDPQIHTHYFAGGMFRDTDPMYRRFSLGNLGKTGMKRFFQAHRCSKYCAGMGMKPIGRDAAFAEPSGSVRHGSVFFTGPSVVRGGRQAARAALLAVPLAVEQGAASQQREASSCDACVLLVVVLCVFLGLFL